MRNRELFFHNTNVFDEGIKGAILCRGVYLKYFFI